MALLFPMTLSYFIQKVLYFCDIIKSYGFLKQSVMATYIDFDSTYRNINTYPNPADYVVEDSQVRDWIREPRTVSANSNRPGNRVIEFTQSLEVEGCILPYTNITYVDGLGVTQTTHTADLQRIYIDVHTLRFNDLRLIYSIEDKLNKARFVLIQDKIQKDSTDTPKWVQFKTNNMDQVTRFSRNEAVKVTFMQERGYTIIIADGQTPDPSKQTWLNLEIKPYFRDADYANHGLGLTQF